MVFFIDRRQLINPMFCKTTEHQEIISDIKSYSDVFQDCGGTLSGRVKKALKWVQEEAQKNRPFSESDILEIHKKIGFSGSYRSAQGKPIGVYRGSAIPYLPADPVLIPPLMQQYVERYSQYDGKKEVLEWICEVYLVFELLHPFTNGNGRTGRLLCAWELIRLGHGLWASELEKCWGRKDRKHAMAFFSEFSRYDEWLANPAEFNEYCNGFYLYFLKELRGMLLAAVKKLEGKI